MKKCLLTSRLTTLFCLAFSAILLASPQANTQQIWVNPPVQLPANVREWLLLEMQENPGELGERTTEAIKLEHIDVQASLLSESIGIGLRPAIYKTIVFYRSGIKYIRWIFNPEDMQYRDEFLNHLAEVNGGRPQIQSRFIGYLTASRSVVVQDPYTKTIFSLKASTNKTGGLWHSKKMTRVKALLSRAYSDFIAKHEKEDPLQAFVALKEPLAFISEATDQAFTIRDYPIFTNPKMRLLPFFSALSIDFAKKFALTRGEDPNDYWRFHLTEPWGRAMAEALAYYGFYPNSAHSQDFLLERDDDGEPTGVVEVRDVMDSHGEEMILNARGANEVLEIYKKELADRLHRGEILMQPIPFNGHPAPPWLNKTFFMDGFYSEFIRRYEALTGVTGLKPPDKFALLKKDVHADSKFLNWVRKLHERFVETLRCEDLFKP